MRLDAGTDRLLRTSLVLVWLATGIISLMELDGQSRQVLVDAGISSPQWLVQALIGAGAVADIVIGLALWLRPSRAVFLTALALMAIMTITATVLQASLWFHPLGPLLKNLPIAAVLWHLARRSA